jgi:hypothetical protein
MPALWQGRRSHLLIILPVSSDIRGLEIGKAVAYSIYVEEHLPGASL